MERYEYARRFMADHGNPNQWGPSNWPPEQLISIKAGSSNVCPMGIDVRREIKHEKINSQECIQCGNCNR